MISACALLAVLLMAVSVASSAVFKTHTNSHKSASPHPPLPPVALPPSSVLLPYMRQSTFYTCGVASLQSCLYYWQVFDSTEQVLAAQCNATEDQGTHPDNIVQVASQIYNLTAFMRDRQTLDDLQKALLGGFTVILDVQAWTDLGSDDDAGSVDWKNDWEDGHYVGLVGIDDNYVFVMDPSTGGTYAYVPKEEFLDRWHDYEIYDDGSRKDYYQLAIYIRGDNPWTVPRPITYMG